MSGRTPIPFTVIGGFLGAGKTTLLNRILRQADGLKIVVLVNDFGSVNIDVSLIASSDGDTIALTNGCACCAIGDDFGRGILRAIERKPTPDHIVVEASGVADPGVLAEIASLASELSLNGVIVLADLANIARQARDRRIGETVRRQLGCADIVVCTKGDIATTAEIAAARSEIDASAADAPRLDLSADSSLVAAILGARRIEKPRVAAAAAEPHASIFSQVTLFQNSPISLAAIEAAFAALPAGVIRAKGFVALSAQQELRLLQKVGRRLEIRALEAGSSVTENAVVLIGDADVFRAEEMLGALGFARSGRRRWIAREV
jgi:G3E family GTPase